MQELLAVLPVELREGVWNMKLVIENRVWEEMADKNC